MATVRMNPYEVMVLAGAHLIRSNLSETMIGSVDDPKDPSQITATSVKAGLASVIGAAAVTDLETASTGDHESLANFLKFIEKNYLGIYYIQSQHKNIAGDEYGSCNEDGAKLAKLLEFARSLT